ncbi:MAG: tRNA lysidine(34) synthetase TilS [Holosporaceae bacterium]|jgi:tRNA(Ile)-lysidine synthase|nr:tRNA lysidine(34) synthetase TilS [Holosporaceae bacterium]
MEEDASFGFQMDFLLDKAEEIYGVSGREICLAVSGGADSMSLLVLSSSWAKKRGFEVSCVTVDHQLRPESAKEAVFVKDFCRAYGVRHHTLKWERPSEPIAYGKLEMLAREARYGLMENFCHANGISLLLTAHQWNDQLETVEMRKRFGSRENGLAGMSRVRSMTGAGNVKLLRPLLYFSKKRLEDFLIARNIAWVNDPMNEDISFRRVACRKQIGDYDQQKIAEYTEEILRYGEIRSNLEFMAVNFIKRFCQFHEDGHADVNLALLLAESPDTQREIIRRIIWSVGRKKYSTFISEERRKKIINREINTIGRCLLRIKRGLLSVFREIRLPYGDTNNRIERENINLYDVFL